MNKISRTFSYFRIKNNFKSGYFWKDEHVPGTTVDLIKKSLELKKIIQAWSSILRSIHHLCLMEVNNTKSLKLTVSFNEFKDFEDLYHKP